MRLYGLQKQGTLGTGRGPMPGLLEPRARAKWRAWAKLGSMDREEAKKEYCSLVDSLVPNWREEHEI